LRRTIIIGGGSVARHEVARCIGSTPIRDAKSLAWDYNTSIYMRALAIIGFFLAVFTAGFFILSLFGLLWYDTYTQIIRSPEWFMTYSVFIGWWLALIPTHEVYNDMFEIL
jgi:hypothetical protein